MDIPGAFNTKDSAGAQLIGFALNWGLYGLLVAQVYTYYVFFPKDPAIHKWLVYGVFSLDTAQTIIVTHDRYQTFVDDFGDAVGVERLRLAWLSVPILCGLIGSIAQVFYAYRIYKLSGSKVLGIIVILLSLVQLTSAIVEGVQAHRVGFLTELRAKVLFSTSIWLVSTVVCDILIAATMTYYLFRFRSNTKRATAFVTRMITLTVETGTITATVALLTGILFIVLPNSEAFNAPAYIIAKLYSISLFRIFNSRIRIMNRLGGEVTQVNNDHISTWATTCNDPVTEQADTCR